MESPNRAFCLAVALLGIAASARAASTLHAATNFGPYRSIDGGVTWKQVFVGSSETALRNAVPAARNLAVDPRNPSNVYATALYASTNAFLRSTDGGQTWSAQSEPGFTFAFALAIDPVKTNVIYASTVIHQVVRSMDSGATWSVLTLPNPTSNVSGVSEMAIDPSTSGVVYVAGPASGALRDGYVLKSTDFGGTWTVLATGLNFSGRIFVDPKNSSTIYGSNQSQNFSCPTSGSAGQCALFKSTDGGKTWSQVPLPVSTINGLEFDANPAVLYAGVPLNSSIMKTVDGGSTWTQVRSTLFSAEPSVRADPSSASTLYANAGATRQEIQKSTDGGANWTTSKLPQACRLSTDPICSFPPQIADFVVAPSPPAAGALPAISANGVVSAASFKPGIAANSWITIAGSNLAGQTDDWSKAIVNGNLPTILDGVSVSVGGKPAYVYFVSPGQINVLAPDIGPGPVTVTVTNSAGTGAAFAATANLYDPAFFAWPGNQAVATRQDYTYAAKPGTFAGATSVPAKPGEVLILWGTGFGPTTPAVQAGVVVPSDRVYSTAANPAVTVGNTPAKVLGAALAPGAAGLYQIAIEVPAALADGDWPIQVSIGGVQSPGGVILSVHQ